VYATSAHSSSYPFRFTDDGGYAAAAFRSIARSYCTNVSLVFLFLAGMDGFVGKPFKIAEIIDKMIELAPKKIITAPW
jgi:hypothetical protein